MSVAPGTRLSHYEIRSQIGAGGMGEVYLAQDIKLGRSIALKILPSEFTENDERLRRFELEASTASSLNHPNIITIHEIGSEGAIHFIATEFIDGESLRQQAALAPMKLRDLLDVAIQIASALTAAHEAGIVHRDIKPENIMVRRDGYVKVLDFGLAKLVEHQKSDASASTVVNTEPGVVMGTIGYMSPEQARAIDVDARTDIWSLGVVIYEMIAGRVPFVGVTTSDTLGLILGDREVPPLSRFARDVPAELDRIVTKALAKDRDERYQTTKDLLNDLKKLKEQLDVEAVIERTGATEFNARVTGAGERGAAVQTVAQPIPDSTPNTQHIAEGSKSRKPSVLIAGAVLLGIVAIAAIAYFGYFARPGGASGEAITSLAVLPFVNVSNNPDAEYLSDGISASLINSLSQLPQLKVIARSSSFKFKGKDTDPREVAKALGVRAILMGRVVQIGDQLQISAELVDTRDNTQVWGDQYSRKTTDLLAMQSDISREIAERLRLKLTNTEQQQLAKRETVNAQAYELMLKGRFYFEKTGTENRRKGIAYYEQAVAADPNYAVAYTELSDSYRTLVLSGVVQPQEYMAKAEAAVKKALELDANLPEAHNALANQRRELWDWATAEREYKRALELNPNLTRAHTAYAFYLAVMGRHDEAIAECKRARDLDPLSVLVNMNVGYRLYFARRYDEAIASLKQTLEMDRNHSLTHLVLGYTYVEQGKYAEALAATDEAIRLGDDSSSTQIFLGMVYARAGDRKRAEEILKQLETSQTYVSPGELADLYVALGDHEKAFASLEKGFAAHDTQLQFLGIDTGLDPLRSDPRLADLKRRVGLPQ